MISFLFYPLQQQPSQKFSEHLLCWEQKELDPFLGAWLLYSGFSCSCCCSCCCCCFSCSFSSLCFSLNNSFRFGTRICYEIFSTIRLLNTFFTSQDYHFFVFMVKTFKTYSLATFRYTIQCC